MKEMLLTPNKYSRPQTKLTTIQKVVVHWVGNAGTSAENNAKYFDSLKAGKKNSVGEYIYASSHYIIGNDGVLVKCVPENEIAYHASSANGHSIGVEMCHPDWGGEFTNKAYKTLIDLLVELCSKYRLKPSEAIIRHYDVTGKSCPKYYVENVRAWEQLKKDVERAMNPVDKDYEKAVRVLSDKVGISTASWLPEPNTKNLTALVEKVGLKLYGINHYMYIVNRMVQDGIISDASLWLGHKYNTNHIRSLIKKISLHLG